MYPQVFLLRHTRWWCSVSTNLNAMWRQTIGIWPVYIHRLECHMTSDDWNLARIHPPTEMPHDVRQLEFGPYTIYIHRLKCHMTSDNWNLVRIHPPTWMQHDVIQLEFGPYTSTNRNATWRKTIGIWPVYIHRLKCHMTSDNWNLACIHPPT